MAMMGGPPMLGGQPMGGPGFEPMDLGKNPIKKEQLPKLIDDSKNKSILVTMVNKTYQLFFIVRSFLKRIMWCSSCIGLMYLFPISLEYMAEKQRLYEKLMTQMGDTIQGGAPPMM